VVNSILSDPRHAIEPLYPLQKDILRYLYNLKEKTLLSDIYKTLGKDRKTVWYSIDALLKKGLLDAKKEEAKQNAPRWLALTPKGRLYAENFCDIPVIERSIIKNEESNREYAKLIPNVIGRTLFFKRINSVFIRLDLFDDNGDWRNSNKLEEIQIHLTELLAAMRAYREMQIPNRRRYLDYLKYTEQFLNSSIHDLLENEKKFVRSQELIE